MRALWLTNTSGLTLDGGSFSVLEEETFAGEGIFEPVRPGEKRLVSYAIDLAVNLSAKQQSEQSAVTRVSIAKGIMTQQSELREKKVYTARNEDTSPRTIIIEHPVRPGFELRSSLQPIETTAGWMRFRVPVAAKETTALALEEVRPLQSTFTVSDLDSPGILAFAASKSIDRTIEEALRAVLAQKDVIDELESQDTEREEEMDKIFNDQERLRENMKALKGTVEEKALTQRYTQQLNQQETRLEQLRKERKELDAKKGAERSKLDKLVASLAFDVKL